MSGRIPVALVDDHRVVLRTLKTYLESFPDIEVVGTAVSGEELLEHLDEWKPQIVLQDERKYTLPIGLANMVATPEYQTDYGVLMAGTLSLVEIGIAARADHPRPRQGRRLVGQGAAAGVCGIRILGKLRVAVHQRKVRQRHT